MRLVLCMYRARSARPLPEMRRPKASHPCDRDGGVNFRRSIEARRYVLRFSPGYATYTPSVFHVELAGSGHDFRGVCFSVAYTTPTANPVEPSRKPDPFTITPVDEPLKTPSIAFWRKKRKKTRNTKLNQKNASESFLEACITITKAMRDRFRLFRRANRSK